MKNKLEVVRQETIRSELFSYSSAGVTQEFSFRDTKPHVLQIQNRGASTIYVSTEKRVSSTAFDTQVVTMATEVWVVPQGVTKFYVTSVGTATLKVISFELKELYPIDLQRTQQTIVTSTLGTTAVSIADGSDVTLGAKADTKSTDETSTNTLMSFIKGLVELSKGIKALLPTALTGSGNFSVAVAEELPAGTQNIGDVDVLSLPSIPAGANVIGSVGIDGSLPAGTNNIGDVDVLSLPSIPAGANVIGSVGIDGSLPAGSNTIGNVTVSGGVTATIGGSLPAGTNNIGDVDVLTLPSIPAGANVIGNVGIDGSLPAGTNNIGDVDVLTLPSIPAGTNNIGKVVCVDLAGNEVDYYKEGDNYNANDHGQAVIMLEEGTPDTYAFLRGNSNHNAMVSVEEIQTIPTGATIYHITLTSADTEYSQALPSGTKKFAISIVDGSDSDNYRIAYETGKVATPTAPYLKFNQNIEYAEENVNLTSKTIYIGSSAGTKTAQLICWT